MALFNSVIIVFGIPDLLAGWMGFSWVSPPVGVVEVGGMAVFPPWAMLLFGAIFLEGSLVWDYYFCGDGLLPWT